MALSLVPTWTIKCPETLVLHIPAGLTWYTGLPVADTGLDSLYFWKEGKDAT